MSAIDASGSGADRPVDVICAAAEVAAMQFAGGMSIAQVATEWDRDGEWVEAAVRRELLKLIPKCDGGLKASRSEMRAAREQASESAQVELEW